VEDNGCGFEANDPTRPRNGHFGLLGIGERAKRLGGKLSITTCPGKGTTVSVEIPLDSTNEPVALKTGNGPEIL
jgi:signal transduction histidine kinase